MENLLILRPKQEYDFDLEEIKKMKCFTCVKKTVKNFISNEDRWVCDDSHCLQIYRKYYSEYIVPINQASEIYLKKEAEKIQKLRDFLENATKSLHLAKCYIEGYKDKFSPEFINGILKKLEDANAAGYDQFYNKLAVKWYDFWDEIPQNTVWNEIRAYEEKNGYYYGFPICDKCGCISLTYIGGDGCSAVSYAEDHYTCNTCGAKVIHVTKNG
jgi:hypothetical protein